MMIQLRPNEWADNAVDFDSQFIRLEYKGGLPLVWMHVAEYQDEEEKDLRNVEGELPGSPKSSSSFLFDFPKPYLPNSCSKVTHIHNGKSLKSSKSFHEVESSRTGV